jgi:N-acetylneuraminic acid mutarotase
VQQLPAKPIRAIHTDSEGCVWAITGSELYRATPPADAWQRHWKSLARMPVANHDIYSGLLDGKLYIFGGMANYGYPAKYTYFNELYVYDVRANRWEIVSRLDPPRAYNGCAAMDGRIWVIGGCLLARNPIPIDRVDIYTPKTGQWEAGPPLPTPRSEAVVVPVNQRIYVIGGTSGKPEPLIYDTLSIGPGETTWRVEPVPPGGTLTQSSGCAIDSKIYVVAPQAKCVLRYDTIARTWEQLPAPPADMTLYAAVCGVHNGELWVMGGNTDKQLTFVYSPKTNSWRSGPNLPTPIGWTSAQEVDGRLIITPGGSTPRQLDDFIFTDTVYELLPTAASQDTR